MRSTSPVKRREFLRAFSFVSVGMALSGCNSSPRVTEWKQTQTSTPKPMTPFDATEPDTFEEEERDALEHQIHNLINTERHKRDLPPLEFNENLTYVARTKSRDMAVKGYFAHTEPDGDSHTDRLENYGYDWETTAENLVQPHATPDTAISVIAKRAVQALMTSPHHREQILHPHYNLEGIGVYVTSNYTIYVTQIFDE